MNNKITTNSELPAINLKKKKKTTKQTLEWEQIHRNRDHMEGYQQGNGRGREG